MSQLITRPNNQQPNKLEKILEAIEELKSDSQNVFVRQRKPVGGFGTLSLQQEEVKFDVENLQKTVFRMIYEYLTYQEDKTYKTESLKNTNFPNTMLLDGIQSALPDYNLLKCFAISDKFVNASFKDPLNLDAILTLIRNTEIEGKKVEEKLEKGRRIVEFSINGTKLFSVLDYSVGIHYSGLASKDLAKGVKLATEITTRIHQDTLLQDKIKQVNFADYVPIFKMLFPELFDDQITGFLKNVRDLSINGKIPKNSSFHETRSSQLSRNNKRYAFDKSSLPDHIDYIVSNPDNQELYIKFGSRLDYQRIEQMLKKQGMRIEDGEKERVDNEKIIKKGGGSRRKIWGNCSRSHDVFDSQGNKILTLEGYSVAKLYFTQNTEQFDLASKVVSDIFYNRLLYTTWMNHSDFKSDLIPTERKIIASMESLVTLYRFFLEVEEQKKAFASDKKFLEPLQWITAKMQESPKISFEERVLYTIQEMDRKIDPQTFYKYGNDKDTQEKVSKFYLALQQLKGRFEGVCAAIKTLG